MHPRLLCAPGVDRLFDSRDSCDDYLVSLPSVSVAYVNSVIPISAVLIIIGQLLVFPEVLRDARHGHVAKAEDTV